MEKIDLPGADLPATRFAGQLYEPQRSAVSWGAVLAGALSMAAFSLVLLTLGTGLGLSSLSPWPGGMHVKTLGIAAIVWVCVTQIMSGALGGYLAGRLRGHWPDITNDEAHFRDTAHGFLAWALATMVTAALLSSLIAATAREGASVTTSLSDTSALRPPDRGDARHAYGTWPMGYLIDGMLRPATGNTSLATKTIEPPAEDLDKQEITRIFTNSLSARGALAPADSDYIAHIVVRRTGVDLADAQARIAATWSRLLDKENALDEAVRAAAEKARKAAVDVSLWLFISLLMGAFAACLLATVGGRTRAL